MAPRRRVERSEVKKGGWSAEEDEVLRQHVAEHGTQNWSSIQSKGLLNRSGKSCRLRWVNKLQPGLKKGKFSPKEERVVLELQMEVGNKWAQIATHLPGRTDNDVKNFWSTRQKRLARLFLQEPPRRRAASQRGCSTSSPLALSRELLRAQQCQEQEPNSSMITFDATPYQEPLEVIHCIDEPSPELPCLPAPADNSAVETEPGTFSTVPLLHYDVSPTRNTSSASAQEGTTTAYYEVGQSSSQEPHEVQQQQCIHDAPLPEVLLLPPPVDGAMEPSSPNTDPFLGTNAEIHVPGAGAALASLHHSLLVEPLAVVPAEPLSFGPDDGGGGTVLALCDNVLAPYVDPLVVIPADADPSLWRDVAAAVRVYTRLRLDLLRQEMIDFFSRL